MNVKHAQETTVVRFSATEVASVGLPPIPAKVEYRNGYLDGYSAWLGKSSWHEPCIDKLIEMADACVRH